MTTQRNPVSPKALPGSQLEACPPETVWQAIAQANSDATLPPEHAPETTLSYLSHAAQCRSCAELLAAATATLAAPEPETPEEAAFLAQLTTSTPAAQLALAHKLGAPRLDSETWAPTPTSPVATTSTLGAPRLDSETWVPTPGEPQPEELQPTFTLPRPRRRFTLWTTLTATALTLCAATIFLVRELRPESDAQLLVLACNRNRLSELRLPGAAAVALASPNRGPDTRQFETIELLKAKTRAQELFDRNPNDPHVRQFRGKVYIVQHDPEAARRDFEMAEALDPNLPGLKFDLATAYFELAESDRANILDYTYAIDYFMQYLQQVHQSDPTALFDLGLCWERRSVVSEAIKNFEAALALEHDPAWRAEIQSHLNKLKALTALDLSPEQLEATLTPQHFLTLTTEAPGQYELYLDAATRKWLPNRQTALVTSTASAAVEKSVPLKGTASAVPQNSLRASGALVSA